MTGKQNGLITLSQPCITGLFAGHALVEKIDLANVKKVLDIGGGSGAYAFAFANASDNITATVF